MRRPGCRMRDRLSRWACGGVYGRARSSRGEHARHKKNRGTSCMTALNLFLPHGCLAGQVRASRPPRGARWRTMWEQGCQAKRPRRGYWGVCIGRVEELILTRKSTGGGLIRGAVSSLYNTTTYSLQRGGFEVFEVCLSVPPNCHHRATQREPNHRPP